MKKKGIKIAMAVTDDIQKIISDSNATLTDLNNQLSNLEKADNAFKSVSDAADKVSANAKKSTDAANKQLIKIANLLDKVEQSAKSLGVDVKMVAGYNDADKMYNTINDTLKNVNSFNWPVASQVSKSF